MSISDQQLKEIITKIVTESLKKSSITTDELMDKMDKFKLSPEQMEQVYEALSENKIEIIDSSEKDKDLLLQGRPSTFLCQVVIKVNLYPFQKNR